MMIKKRRTDDLGDVTSRDVEVLNQVMRVDGESELNDNSDHVVPRME